jgi:Asp-tRNA(Asn)/Glu-tRNA(Gln) amidotransferase C subunit
MNKPSQSKHLNHNPTPKLPKKQNARKTIEKKLPKNPTKIRHQQKRSESTQTTSLTKPQTSIFRPFGGIDELNASTQRLHLPLDHKVDISTQDITKLSQLAYLSPPATPEDIKRTTNRVNSMVNWLSSITSLDVGKLPYQQYYKQLALSESQNIDKNDTITQLYSNNPTSIPFYTPLLIMPKFVAKSAIGVKIGEGGDTDLTTDDCSLRIRGDIVEVCNAQSVLTNATYSERGFYVAPKFNAGDD